MIDNVRDVTVLMNGANSEKEQKTEEAIQLINSIQFNKS